MKATWSDDWDSSLSDDQEYVANMRFIAIESDNEESREYGEWFLDSACSRHMTKDDSLFSSISKINGGKVTFKDNLKVKIIGVGNIRGYKVALLLALMIVLCGIED
uniref:Retrovirus-related Pol polyprotein from transposon TNT 1-94-like beta-barrel domain-containing protein n=1 Tax=Populus trichocarpa TaxID=3694 RepID=A0A2K2A209_POPTR